MVHLHLHTHFSFGIGVSRPEVLAAAAAQRGHRALACTDTNGVYGAIEFQRACDAAGIRPILGAHLVTDEEETVALATNERGWGALCRAITEIHWARHGATAHRSRRVRSAPVRQPLDRSGRPPSPLARHRLPRARRRRERARDLYAELIPGKERHAVLAAARRLGLSPVATNAVVMAHPEDWSLPSPPARHSSQHDDLRVGNGARRNGATAQAARLTLRRRRRAVRRRAERCLAPPHRRPHAPLPRLPRGGARDGGDRRALRVPDPRRPSRRPAPHRRGRRAPAAPRPRLRGRAATLRHDRAGDPRAPGARARHHRA